MGTQSSAEFDQVRADRDAGYEWLATHDEDWRRALDVQAALRRLVNSAATMGASAETPQKRRPRPTYPAGSPVCGVGVAPVE